MLYRLGAYFAPKRASELKTSDAPIASGISCKKCAIKKSPKPTVLAQTKPNPTYLHHQRQRHSFFESKMFQ
jgi:hypothetical protein